MVVTKAGSVTNVTTPTAAAGSKGKDTTKETPWQLKSKVGFINLLGEDEETAKCGACSVLVEKQGTRCDLCQYWFHKEQTCSGLRPSEYTSLTKLGIANVKWFCPRCLEDQAGGMLESHRDRRMAAIETKIDKLMNIIERKEKEEADFEVKIKKMIAEEVKEQLVEKEEREKREDSIVISGIAEEISWVNQEDMSEDEKVKAGENLTEQNVTALLKTVLGEDERTELQITAISRVGKKTQERPRSIRVKLGSKELKTKVMRRAPEVLRKINGRDTPAPKRIYINHDLTYNERQRQFELRKQLKEKKTETGENDWIIRGGKIVKREDKTSDDVTNGSDEQ